MLVVSDDLSLQPMLGNYLEQCNVRVVSGSRRQELTWQFAASEPSVVILDLQSDQEDGLDLLREIRSRSWVPLIIIGDHKRGEMDRVAGLELGADDYVIKPIVLRELLARIRAVLRRRKMGRNASQRRAGPARCQFGCWQLDRRVGRLTDPDGATIALTKVEYGLLIAFLDAPQRPLTREHLLRATRVLEDHFDRSIDVQVHRLRRKLETDPSAPHIIKTERGFGYVFTLSVDPL
jgi:DNA-binding response OmpR family regulator